jgi:hypothetical protein
MTEPSPTYDAGGSDLERAFLTHWRALAPDARVIAPGGEEAMLLHPNPRHPERWLVYRHPWQRRNHNVPTCEYWDASELRKADNVSDR